MQIIRNNQDFDTLVHLKEEFMGVKNCLQRWSAFLFILTFLFIFWGCSGGGGGGVVSAGGGGATGLTYTGLTSEATVDADNARILLEAALSGGSTSFGGGVIAAGAVTTGGQAVQRPMKVVLMMKTIADQLKTSSSLHNVAVGAVVSESGTVYGSCNGEATYSISRDEDTGEFSGTITFNSYCENGVTYNGSAGFSGIVIIDGDETYLDPFEFDFNSVSCNALGTPFTIDGTMEFRDFYYNWPYPYVIMNMVYRDDWTGKTYQMTEDFVVYFDFEYMGDYGGFYYGMEGKFYHPDYGYVMLTTPDAFWQYYSAAYPNGEYGDGELWATGAIGVGGWPTYASLLMTYDSGGSTVYSYEIFADVDGDNSSYGDYDAEDYYSEELNWIIVDEGGMT